MQEKILPIIALLILLLGGGYLLFQKTPAPQINIIDLKGFNPPLGNPEAPVKIIEFADFQCFFCKKFYMESFRSIKEDYINKGLAVLYYRDFIILGPESTQASLASKCAREQNKYWAYVDLLYENQGLENSGAFNKENLIKFAEKLNLDKNKFEKCLNEGKYIKEIEEDTKAALKLGARGTPYIIINNDKIEGAYPYKYIKAVIEKYLKK